jgi:hypothetical protein
MAVTWDVKITNVSVQNKRADIVATRTDGSSSLEPQVYSMQNTPIGTAADRVLVLNTIKGWVEQEKQKAQAVAAIVTNMQQDAIANLVAWELTR